MVAEEILCSTHLVIVKVASQFNHTEWDRSHSTGLQMVFFFWFFFF